MIRRPEHILKLQPYKAGKSVDAVAREYGLTDIVKLASNENPLGVSPKAQLAAQQSLQKSNRYADPSGYDLVHKLAGILDQEPGRIILGAGIDSLLGYIISTFSEPGDELLTSAGTFTGIYVHTNKLGRKLSQVPLVDYGYDLEGLIDRITPATRLIYLANPNNPTGTMISKSELEDFLSKVPDNVVVILDEAYHSYARLDQDYPNGLDYDYPNLIVTRTFSKDYGLAGLRIGYAVGAPDLISDLMRVRLPFEPSYPAQQAAMAALDDQEFLNQTLKQNQKSLKRFKLLAQNLGIKVPESHANFLMFAFESPLFAAQFTEACLTRGLILRHVESFGVPDGVRINSGTDEETEFAERVINEVFPIVERQVANPALRQ